MPPSGLNLAPAPAPESFDSDGKVLWARLAPAGQQHVLQFWDSLGADEKANLKADVGSVDLDDLQKWYSRTKESPAAASHSKMEALPDEAVTDNVNFLNPTDEVASYRDAGLKLTAGGKVAAVLMAGGQGTRLGSKNPKGMFPLELKEGRTLLEIQAFRIRKLQELAGNGCSVPWYIMTSGPTKEPTVAFLQENSFFGLNPDDVVIFEQATIPCLTTDGKMILGSKSSLSRAPDGNGGIYFAMVKHGIVQDMEKRGIEFVHVYGVDNILVQVADPAFTGFLAEKKLAVGAKVIVKQDPTEKVGHICLKDGKYDVVEYSEIDPKVAELRRADGGLVFSAGSIANHLYTMDFVKVACEQYKLLKHHVANKKIPFIGPDGNLVTPTEPNGIKLELFVFDVFRFGDSMGVLQVDRNVEFSPLKNASSAGKDCVDTCRAMTYALNRSFLNAPAPSSSTPAASRSHSSRSGTSTSVKFRHLCRTPARDSRTT
jgi:UDP-N-acetylglucosamine/UDP-N-acetylgalactosamine diphosphorylase